MGLGFKIGFGGGYTTLKAVGSVGILKGDTSLKSFFLIFLGMSNVVLMFVL